MTNVNFNGSSCALRTTWKRLRRRGGPRLGHGTEVLAQALGRVQRERTQAEANITDVENIDKNDVVRSMHAGCLYQCTLCERIAGEVRLGLLNFRHNLTVT